MDQIQMTPQAAIAATTVQSAERVTAFLRKVYGWMCVGLAITATVALGVASSPTLVQAIFGNKILFFGLFIAELGLVFYLSARINKIAAEHGGGAVSPVLGPERRDSVAHPAARTPGRRSLRRSS